MPTGKMMLVLLVVLVAFGIVGRMDYEDAKRMEHAGSKEAIRLFCVRVPIDASAERGRSKSAPAIALLVATRQPADDGMPARTVLRCVVVDE